MNSDELLGTVLGIALSALICGVILLGLFYRPKRHKKLRSRARFTRGIDDVSIDGDGTGGGPGGGD
ncbi:hypothetical protein [Pseudophaeobacter sp.]|uniref:hypothetical protein n=1 Tax=Pseudophaeobacter sp. TaxID=1971739 RepID=UPI004057EC68